MNTKHASLSIAAVAALVTLTSCSGPAPESDAGSGSGSGGTVDCGTVSTATLDDDSFRVAVYALDNDLIESDIISDVEVSYMQIPALIQATSSGQFTFPSTSLPGLTLARVDGGIDVRPVAFALAHTGGGFAIYTSSESGIDGPEDLAGKSLATPSFGSTATQQAKIVLSEEYGLDVAFEGGDLRWVELDPPTQLNALKQGDVDAALMWHQGAWLAENDPEITKVVQLDEEYKDLLDGSWPVGSTWVVEGAYAEENPDCVAEFQRMLAESVAYGEENYGDFAEEIAEISGVPVEFIEYWWGPEDNYQFGGVMNEEWLTWADSFYRSATDQGLLPEYEDIREIAVLPASE